MTDREKLVELLGAAEDDYLDKMSRSATQEQRYEMATNAYAYYADHLLTNGVTVQKHGRWEEKCTGRQQEWTVKPMDRLTFLDDFGEPCFRLGDTVYKNEISRRLAHYEDLEEQGVLKPVICDVGGTVWDKKAEPWNVISIEWFSRKVTHLHCVSPVTGIRHTFTVGKRSLNKTVFLTREEAEAALSHMEKGENE